MGTPITAGRLQQVSTNISEVKSATDIHAKGILTFEEFTSPVGSVDADGVLHTGLTGTISTIANLNGGQRITLEADRYYKVALTIPDITIGAGHPGSWFEIVIDKTVSSTFFLIFCICFILENTLVGIPNNHWIKSIKCADWFATTPPSNSQVPLHFA